MNIEDALLADIKRQNAKLAARLIVSLVNDVFFILTVITMVKVWLL